MNREACRNTSTYPHKKHYKRIENRHKNVPKMFDYGGVLAFTFIEYRNQKTKTVKCQNSALVGGSRKNEDMNSEASHKPV